MAKRPVNIVSSGVNVLKVSDTGSQLELAFKDSEGVPIDMKDSIEYFYLTPDKSNYYPVTDIEFYGDSVLFRPPNLPKGNYYIEVKDTSGRIFPAGQDIVIHLRESFESGKEAEYVTYKDAILSDVEPIIVTHMTDNAELYKGDTGEQGEPGPKGEPFEYDDFTPEQLEGLKGPKGDKGDLGEVTDGSVTEDKLADKAVSPEKTSFMHIGKNKFNKDDVVFDKLYSSTSGNLVDVSGYASTITPMDAEENTTYHRNTGAVVVLYDNDLNFIGGESFASGPYTTPVGTRYQRFSTHTGSNRVETLQIEEGGEPTSYESFRYEIEKLHAEIEDNSLDAKALKNRTINKDKLNFTIPEAEPTSNLFDKEKITNGYYVSQSTGELGANASHYTSDYMPVKVGTTHSFKEESTLRIAYYDENEVFISGALAPTSPITTPENAKYVRISSSMIPPDEFQFSEGATLPSYEPYGYRLPDLISSTSTSDIKINLSDDLHALVGEELNIYYDNLIPGDYTDYEFDVDFGGKGAQYERFFRFVPDVAESRDITIKIIKDNQILASKTSTIVVTETSVGSGITKEVLVIGDSTTNNGTAITKLNDNFSGDVMNISTVGTRGTSPNNHEGRSGWRASNYINDASVSGVTNAFYNPNTSTFDFAYYITNSGVVEPDYVVINLGINDLFPYYSDESAEEKIDEVLAEFETMIASIHAYNSSIKVGIALTIPPNYSQDAFGKDYETGQTRNRYKRNNIILVSKMIETFSDRESESVHVIPTNAVIDTKYNFGLVDEPVNARNTTVVQRPPGNSGVHPDASGYWQIADAYWFWLKSFEV